MLLEVFSNPDSCPFSRFETISAISCAHRVDFVKLDARIENRKTLDVLDVHEGLKTGRDFSGAPQLGE